jgi:hypothetical protein
MIKTEFEQDDEIIIVPSFKAPHLYQHTVTGEIILATRTDPDDSKRYYGLVVGKGKNKYNEIGRYGTFLTECLVPWNKKIIIQNDEQYNLITQNK